MVFIFAERKKLGHNESLDQAEGEWKGLVRLSFHGALISYGNCNIIPHLETLNIIMIAHVMLLCSLLIDYIHTLSETHTILLLQWFTVGIMSSFHFCPLSERVGPGRVCCMEPSPHGARSGVEMK